MLICLPCWRHDLGQMYTDPPGGLLNPDDDTEDCELCGRPTSYRIRLLASTIERLKSAASGKT